MLSIKAKFDGEKIEIPVELRGAAPANVLIIYPTSDRGAVSSDDTRRSFRDFYGAAGTNRTTEEINRQVREDRDSWDES